MRLFRSSLLIFAISTAALGCRQFGNRPRWLATGPASFAPQYANGAAAVPFPSPTSPSNIERAPSGSNYFDLPAQQVIVQLLPPEPLISGDSRVVEKEAPSVTLELETESERTRQNRTERKQNAEGGTVDANDASAPGNQPADSNGPSAEPAQKPTASVFPAGIPQFSHVRPGVATGLRPFLDGLDWLEKNGYRTILYIYRPATDDVADRKQVEKRGMEYLSFPFAADALTYADVERFNRIVSAKKNQPLFVYDKDGVLTAGMWYLYFRSAEKLDHQDALTRSPCLDIGVDQTSRYRDMWLSLKIRASDLGN